MSDHASTLCLLAIIAVSLLADHAIKRRREVERDEP